jgi:hypothetical protein
MSLLRPAMLGNGLPQRVNRCQGVTPAWLNEFMSIYTHPTGHLHVASTDWYNGYHRQAGFDPRSTVHDEGRLCEPALSSFAQALATVAR